MSLQFLRQLSKNALDRFKVRDLGLTAEGLEAWGKTDFGCYLRHHEHRVLKHKYAPVSYTHLTLPTSDLV